MEPLIIYHEASPDSLDQISSSGLRCTPRDTSDDEPAITRTNRLLDDLRPAAAIEADISRNNNLYAYVGIDDKIVDITDGNHVELTHFVKHNANAVLRLQVDPHRCFVSDLDQYDAIHAALTSTAIAKLEIMAQRYWEGIIPLHIFKIGDIRRPEVMITYDLQPSEIRLLES